MIHESSRIFTNAASPILAKSDDDIFKIIFGLIFLAIWAIGAVISAANKNKKKQQQQRPQQAQQPSAWDKILEEITGVPKQRPEPPPLPTHAPPQRRPMTMPPPLPQHRPMPAGTAQRPVPIRKKFRPKPVRQAAVRRPVTPPMPVMELEEAEGPAHAMPAASVSGIEVGGREGAASKAAAAAAHAVVIGQSLTPGKLRNQFILLEILQPPVALRER